MVEEERESSCLGNGQVRITVQLQVCRQDAVAVETMPPALDKNVP